MLKRTKRRLRDLCEQAIAAKDQSEGERKASELRVALGEHITAARESLSSQASVIPVLDSIAGARPVPKKGKVSTSDGPKYPWQSPALEAFREFNADQLLKKISIAENAISKRLLELNGAADQEEETYALHDAQNTLATLKRHHQ